MIKRDLMINRIHAHINFKYLVFLILVDEKRPVCVSGSPVSPPGGRPYTLDPTPPCRAGTAPEVYHLIGVNYT